MAPVARSAPRPRPRSERAVPVLLACLAAWALAQTPAPTQAGLAPGNSGEPSAASLEPGGRIPSQYIVLFDETVTDPRSLRRSFARAHDLTVLRAYHSAISGFAAHMSSSVAWDLEDEPGVALVEQDGFATAMAQTLPTGVDRLEIDRHPIASIDGSDTRVDVDIAILDTGVDLDHPDLDVHVGVDCTTGLDCATGGDGDDGDGHGTHVAGTAAALDNDIGVVGTAPGARVWAIKVLADDGTGSFSDVLAGIDYVTEHSDAIEVANMSLGGEGRLDSLRAAVARSVEAGVFYSVAAGNASTDVYGADGALETLDDRIPAAYPEVATITALSDTDGKPGGSGPASSWQGSDRDGDGVDDGEDDSFAFFSNSSAHVVAENPVASTGKAIDLMLPGVDIVSTWKDGTTRTLSGTSMAAPHAAGLAALHVAGHGRAYDGAGVAAIRSTLVEASAAQEEAEGLAILNDPDANPEHVPAPFGLAQALAAISALVALRSLDRAR